jgi:hypothetical protein
VERGSGGFRLFQQPLAGGPAPAPLLSGPLSVTHQRLSPDFHAMTFVAGQNEGRMDVYVSPMPVTSQPQKVAGGVSGPARWSREQNRIYWLNLDGTTMMTMAISTVPSLEFGAQKELFKLRRPAKLQDVYRDGSFLLLVPYVRAAERPIIVATAPNRSTRR